MVNVDRVKNKKKPHILASASRAYDLKHTDNSFSYVAKSPIETTNVSRVLLPKIPVSVLVNGVETFQSANWDEKSNTYLVGFENNPDGVPVSFKW